MPIDSTVRRETQHVAAVCGILSLFLQAVFLALSEWTAAVLLGNLLGVAAATANFLLMGVTVQAAVLKDEKDARRLIRWSQSLRLVMLFAVALGGCLLPCFHPIAVVVPLLFSRIAVAVRTRERR